MDFLYVTQSLFEGFAITCLLFGLTLVMALPLGLAISFGSMCKFKPVKYLFKVIIWIVRGIPLMLQIFIFVYLPSKLWAKIDKFFLFEYDISFGQNGAGMGTFIGVVIAFVINYACYFSEIFRGGIESVSKGQQEAGQVLGMTKRQIFSKVVLLQVVKRIIPPMSNEIITLVKDTALANAVSVIEIIKRAEMFTMRAVWPLFYSGVFYLIFVGVLTLLFGYVERKLSYFKV